MPCRCKYCQFVDDTVFQFPQKTKKNNARVSSVDAVISRRFEKAGEEQRDLAVSFFVDGNFTVAMVEDDDDRYVGVSKRNPLDPDDPVRGQMLALQRALDKLFEEPDLPF